ncbi:TAXI family TRAP transporter solute-binding subunit [Heyndrickxia oleronia]|uniref:TAXI family TRAP transporter solute-binding subunit n=1 Tax=Heyndrickxia oleronia TaxID=38875 RepID=UPI00203CC9D8|nr:TAXI family TRAP transporter solute-binding subunit [Heyndrickxia oleronia]MCM3454632.1 TAXI family TRAP transporter solute-binding subunit [Heyndrickxia oleronia]
MKRRSLFLGAVIMLSLSMILAACGGEKKSSGDAKGDSKVKLLTIATGGTGGTYYPLGGMMGKIIKDETGINADVITSGASSENMAILKDNKADIAFTQTDIVSYATKGELMFDGKKIDSLKGLGTLYPETIQIVTTKSDIKSVEDLKGKVVSVGAAGSGTRANAEQILEAYGMSFDDIKVRDLSFDDSTAGIQDGSIDAAFITAGTPTSAVEGLSATDTVSIVPIDADKADALIEKYPFYIKDEVPADTYKIKEAVPTIAVLSMLVVREDLPEAVVYKVTKAIYENTDKIKHSKAQFIKAESALNGMSIDLHPGAKKYFDEKGISQK